MRPRGEYEPMSYGGKILKGKRNKGKMQKKKKERKEKKKRNREIEKMQRKNIN
jgi:hypothetical protein